MSISHSDRINAGTKTAWDVIVIGGGITGASVARDAALRGLKVLLLEKNDFASGTSSRSSKLVHGGLRYLKQKHFRLVFESCSERYRLWKHVAPHLVKPIRFNFVFYSWSRIGRVLIVLGLLLYDFFALFRNPGGFFRLRNINSLKKAAPALTTIDLLGGASYSDCSCFDARLVIDTLKSAETAKALIFNYCEVTSIEPKEPCGFILTVHDHRTNSSLSFTSSALINATGAWADSVLALSKSTARFALRNSRGIHLIFRKQDFNLQETFALENPDDGRNIFVIPWGNYVLAGTTDVPHAGDPGDAKITAEETEYLLKILKCYFPAAKINKKTIHASYAGVRPLIGSDQSLSEEEIPRDFEIQIEKNGFISVTGGKLTTCRHMAEKVVDDLIRNFFSSRNLSPCRTLSSIGTTGHKTLALTTPDHQLTMSEVEYCVQEEQVEHLDDLFCRRSMIFLFSEDRGRNSAPHIARHIGKLLGWDSSRINKEVQHYLDMLDKETPNS